MKKQLKTLEEKAVTKEVLNYISEKWANTPLVVNHKGTEISIPLTKKKLKTTLRKPHKNKVEKILAVKDIDVLFEKAKPIGNAIKESKGRYSYLQ